MACGAREETDPFNCLLAWQSDTWTGSIDWTQCRVVVGEIGARLDCRPTKHYPFVSVSSASVTFAGTQADFPWQLALSQGGSGIYTWRKAAGPDAEWLDERSLFFRPEAGIPAVGSRAGGSGHRFVATLSKH